MLRSAWLAGVLCLVLFTFPAAADSPIGEVVATAGSASASGLGGSRGLAAGSAVYEADRIMTGNGNVQIVFIDNTRLLIGPPIDPRDRALPAAWRQDGAQALDRRAEGNLSLHQRQQPQERF